MHLRRPAIGHVIAARITAENTKEGFKPNGGYLDQVRFPGNSKTWGYFSVYSHGKIHNYSDSQFGHVFSQGNSRKEAATFLIDALKGTTITADFRTNLDYVAALLNHTEFTGNMHTTTWLDGLIKNDFRPPKIDSIPLAICAAALISFSQIEQRKQVVTESLRKRNYPNKDQLNMKVVGKFIHEGIQYSFKAAPASAEEICITLCSQDVYVRLLPSKDKSFMISFSGKSYNVQHQKCSNSIYLTVNGTECLIEFESDPSSIRSPSSGRLVRFLVEENSLVTIDAPIAEIEVMKMFMTVYSKASGVISFKKQPGLCLIPGELIGKDH